MTKLNWEKNGRSFYAHAGKLTLQVKIAPPRRLGNERRWMVGEILGHSWLGESKTFPDFEAAAVYAEQRAREAIQQASNALASLTEPGCRGQRCPDGSCRVCAVVPDRVWLAWKADRKKRLGLGYMQGKGAS